MTFRFSLLPALLLAVLEPAAAETVARPASEPFDPRSIVFIGSSSIDFWKTLPDDFPEDKVVNLGKAGTTFSHLVSRAGEWATAYPADFLRIGNQRGRIATGLRADLVELGADFEVVRTWPD